MNLVRKMEIASLAVRSISTHDDAPESEVRRFLQDLEQLIRDELAAAAVRREEKRAPKE